MRRAHGGGVNGWRWLLLALAALAALPAAADRVYRWTDADGNVHFSDKAPEGSGAQEVMLHIPSFGGSAETSTESGFGTRAVTLYTTVRCGYCKRARAYLKKRGIAFTDHDVETSATGKAEFKRLQGMGVPIVLVGNQRMDGFDEARLDEMLRKAGNK